MKVEFTKAAPEDPSIQSLAKATGESAKAICAMVNQQRYRAAYNKLNQERMKLVRKLVKEHPELLGEGK